MRSALARASGPPLQSSTTSNGRGAPVRWWVCREAANHPAQVRIIRFVFPDPDEPITT